MEQKFVRRRDKRIHDRRHNYFEDLLKRDDEEEEKTGEDKIDIQHYGPHLIMIPSTREEMKQRVKNLKNQKTLREGDATAELKIRKKNYAIKYMNCF